MFNRINLMKCHQTLLIATVISPFLISSLFSQSQGSISLLGHLSFPGKVVTDVWGYVDTNSGKEYALVGYGVFADPPNAGLLIVDVSDPTMPNLVADLNTVPGQDIKVWLNYVYTVNGIDFGQPGPGGIVDMTNPENPQVVGSFPTAHNIFISESGFMYTVGPGLLIHDLNPDPTKPTFVKSLYPTSGHDVAVIGNRLYDFNGNSTRIFNLSQPDNPQFLARIEVPSIIELHHSGWVTEDERFLFICDELADFEGHGGQPVVKPADFTVWDISDLGSPEKVGQFSDPDASVHNLYIIGNYAFVSYYSAGFRVFDVSDPTNPTIADEFDTSPATGPIDFSSSTIVGTWGVYPFAPSGNIYVSDITTGLYIFSFSGQATAVNTASSDIPKKFVLFDNYPNPFNPATVIAYQLSEVIDVELAIYNPLGQKIKTLVNERQGAGTYQIRWDGQDNTGQRISSGVYLYRLTAGSFIETRKMVLLR